MMPDLMPDHLDDNAIIRQPKRCNDCLRSDQRANGTNDMATTPRSHALAGQHPSGASYPPVTAPKTATPQPSRSANSP